MAQQQAFLNALQAQGGIGNQSAVFNQLQNVASGTGPNPAQAMLANTTGQNVANQAAMMAAQRGSGANAGLIARQAAMQGANTQQQAAGQAAALQAQQSLNAMGQMGALANQQVAQQQSATSGMTNAQLQSQQNLLNSIAGQNQSAVAMQSNINNANAGLASGIMGGQQQMFGNIMGGIGSAFMPAGKAEGGMITKMAEGGEIPQDAQQDAGGFKSFAGQFLQHVFNPPSASEAVDGPIKPGGYTLGTGAHKLGEGIGRGIAGLFAPSSSVAAADPGLGGGAGPLQRRSLAEGGKVPALLSPGEKYLSPQQVEQVKAGANPMHIGQTVPGKPKVGGAKNDYANDTVKANLDEGGIVVPRSVTKSKDADKKAEAFVKAVIARNNHGRK